jgi:hypothetical protein
MKINLHTFLEIGCPTTGRGHLYFIGSVENVNLFHRTTDEDIPATDRYLSG